MKRQRVRQALILFSLLLFPITLYYFSPALVLEGAAQGIVVGSLVVFGLQFLASLVLGGPTVAGSAPAPGCRKSASPCRTSGPEAGGTIG